MRSDRSRNTVIIVILLIAILSISVGYAALSQQLTISGTASTGSASWNVNFSSITKNATLTTLGANEEDTPNVMGTSATFNVSFDYPGARIVYDLIVSNDGTIDATYVDYGGLEEVNQAEPLQIQYSIDRLNPDDDTVLTSNNDLLSGEKNKFRITIEWLSTDDTVPTENKEKVGTLVLNYRQKS